MKIYLKKAFIGLLTLFAIVCALFAQVPKTYAVGANNQDKALIFLSDVVKLDMPLYTVKLDSQFVDFPPHLTGIATEVIYYDLNCKNESVLYATFRFRDNKLYGYSITAVKGSPIYAEPQAANAVDSVNDVLERYMEYSQAEYVRDMQSCLRVVDSTNAEVTVGNVKLVTSKTEIESVILESFSWSYTVGGVNVPQNTVNILLEDGVFSSLTDNWNLYKIGSEFVNVSQKEAVAIARKAANDYKLMIMLDDWVEVSFKLKEEPVTTDLFMYPREELTVFPFWDIELYFDEQHYSAYGLQVGIWADTGEIAYCKSLTHGGGSINEGPPQDNSSLLHILGVTVLCIVVIAVVTTVVVLRKK